MSPMPSYDTASSRRPAALSRRGFLGLLGGVGATSALAACGLETLGGLVGQTAEFVASRAPLPKPFRVALPVPRVKPPVRSDGTTDYYEIVQRVAHAEILPGLRTPIFGYDGTFPGPTLVTSSGRRAVVRHRNELPVPAAVHLHGGHTPAESDGFATDLILPVRGWDPHAGDVRSGVHGSLQGAGSGTAMAGKVTHGTRDYVYPLEQRAATLWYHDHRMDFTGPQVYRGLAGLHLVHDDEERALPLPDGERDIPLLICDRAFEEDGAFRYPSIDRTLSSVPGVRPDFMEGVVGDVILVNGAPWPVLEVEAVRYRFRILNASNARRYRLALTPAPSDGPAFVQIGSDGGLLEHPVEHKSLDIASAERFDVIVDFSAYKPGTAVTLVNQLGSGTTARVMRFRVGRRVKDDSRIPDRLSRIERLDPAKAVRTREWWFRRGDVPTGGASDPDGGGGGSTGNGGAGNGGAGSGGNGGSADGGSPGGGSADGGSAGDGGHDRKGWTINGRSFDARRIDASPRLGEIEIWRFVTDLHHPVHVHLDPFQVVSRGGHDPGDFDAGWKDTVDLRPAEYVEVAVRFTDYRGPYLLHCHNLEHEDMAMMATFETT